MMNKTNKYTRLADSQLGYGGILVADLFKTQNLSRLKKTKNSAPYTFIGNIQ